MPRRPALFRSARMRLLGSARRIGEVGTGGDGARLGPAIYRPLVVGAAILTRLPAAVDRRRRWQVDVAPGARLLPDAPDRAIDVERVVAWRRLAGETCRIGAALVSAADLGAGDDADRAADAGLDRWMPASPRADVGGPLRPRGPAIEMYGWALLYRLGDSGTTAFVDPHEDHDDLPAFYESPLELLDRANFLASRGVATRPIALVTRPEDFVRPAAAPVNRFFPTARCRPPADLRRLF